MPPKSEEPLTPEELALIKLWIDQGAKAPTTRPREAEGRSSALPPASVHPVRGIAVSPDKSAVAASRGNQIHIYDAGSGTYIRSLDRSRPEDAGQEAGQGRPPVAGRVAGLQPRRQVPRQRQLPGSDPLGRRRPASCQHASTGFADRVVALAFSPDSKLLATGGGAPTEDGEIKVFDVPTGKLVIDIKNGHSDTVFGVCFSPDGKMLATCGADKFVKVFEVPSGKFIKAFEGHTHHVLDVGWKADGKLLASAGADNVVKVWDYEKGEQVRTINAHTKQVTRLLFIGKTGQFVTCSGDHAVR